MDVVARRQVIVVDYVVVNQVWRDEDFGGPSHVDFGGAETHADAVSHCGEAHQWPRCSCVRIAEEAFVVTARLVDRNAAKAKQRIVKDRGCGSTKIGMAWIEPPHIESSGGSPTREVRVLGEIWKVQDVPGVA